MEGKESEIVSGREKLSELNDVQYKILNSLYFVEGFGTLLEEVREPAAVIADELRTLIDKGMVQVMQYNEGKSDYEHSIMYDTDDMSAFFYVATRHGMNLHNQSRRG